MGKEGSMQSKTRALVLGTVVALNGALSVARAQATDPVYGTWELNVAKSTYNPGPAPKSSTRTYVAVANGYKFSSKGVDAAGKATSGEFTAYFDGKYHPMTGSANVDSIMVKRIDANRSESTQKKGSKVLIHTTRTISADGKTMTATATGTNADGKAYKNVEIYNKK
jgi:hypothetical protein